MVSEDGIGLGKAGSPNIIIIVRMLVTKAAMMKYSRASAGDILKGEGRTVNERFNRRRAKCENFRGGRSNIVALRMR